MSTLEGEPRVGETDSPMAWRANAEEGRALVLLLDFDPNLRANLARLLCTRSDGLLSIYACGTSSSFREVYRQLAGDPRPLILVGSDYVHPGELGDDDLTHAAAAPAERTCGGVRQRAAPRLMMSGSFSPDQPVDAARVLTKPYTVMGVQEACRDLVATLADRVRADLEASGGDWVEGASALGPRETVQASLTVMEQVEEALSRGRGARGRPRRPPGSRPGSPPA